MRWEILNVGYGVLAGGGEVGRESEGERGRG